ncbi:MAG: hypothetical protein ACREQ5_22700 [Candidatus Dormibacteria bacterium]
MVDATRPAPDASLDEVALLRKRIGAGHLDDRLHELGQAIARRLYLLSALDGIEVKRGFTTGDRVAIRPTVRPRYLHGLQGTVECWLGSRVMVRLDRPIGRFIDARVRCLPDGLERISRT